MNNRTKLISLLVSAEEKEFLLGIADEVHLSLTDFVLLSALSTNVPKENWQSSRYQRRESTVKEEDS